jgi:hypothetical protein
VDGLARKYIGCGSILYKNIMEKEKERKHEKESCIVITRGSNDNGNGSRLWFK